GPLRGDAPQQSNTDLKLSRLEDVKHVLRTRCRPQGEELVIRIGEGPTTADRHETRVALFREDHTSTPSDRVCPTSSTMPPAPSARRAAPGPRLRTASPAAQYTGALESRPGRGERRDQTRCLVGRHGFAGPRSPAPGRGPGAAPGAAGRA